MARKHLLAAVCSTPLLLMAAHAAATDTISTATTAAVATATATNNGPDNIDVASGGSIALSASGPVITLNSNNTVTMEGAVASTDQTNSVGVKVLGGFTGAYTNNGTISLSETYTATQDQNTGLYLGKFASGSNRIGLQVVGPGIFTGPLNNFTAITIHGQNSYDVSIETPVVGSYQSLKFTAATSTTTATLSAGSLTMVGENSTAFRIAPTGSVTGNVTLGSLTVSGPGAHAIDIEGAVGGSVSLASTVTNTGYRSTSRSSYAILAQKYTAEEMQQGGAAVVIGANLGGGFILTAPPLDAVAKASTASDTIGGVSVLQTVEGTASVTNYGGAPAIQIGSAARTVELGVVGSATTVRGGAGQGAYGFVNEGVIAGNGVFDTVTTPNLPAPVAAQGVVVGTTGGLATVIDGGLFNAGSIGAQSYQADATAVHFLAGASTPLIRNDAVIVAQSEQQTTTTTGHTPVKVNSILIDAGASVGSIVNNGGISAIITGTSGVGGSMGGIIDRSGSVSSFVNTGTILAQATQTVLTAPMPVTAVAVDLSARTGAQTLSQGVSPSLPANTDFSTTTAYTQGAYINYKGVVYQAITATSAGLDPVTYPTYWRQVGATSPFIVGSVLLGSGGSSVNLTAGIINAPIFNLGTGSNNSLIINGPSGGSVNSTQITGAIEEVSASLAQAQVAGTAALAGGGNGTLSIAINNGALIDTNPNVEQIKDLHVGSKGELLVAIDPVAHKNTTLVINGAATIDAGAQIGVAPQSLLALKSATFTVVETAPGQGSLSAGAFATGQLTNSPWLYSEVASYVPAANPLTDSAKIQVTVTRKSTAELGFNAAEAAALDAILTAAPNNSGVQTALLTQTSAAGLKTVYDQLMPDQGQGLFEALDAAAQAESAMTSLAPVASSRVPGTSLWLQEINQRVERSGPSTLASNAKLTGLVGGYEYTGPGGGSLGVSLSYFNVNEVPAATQLGSGMVASVVEAGAYYRRTAGRFSVSARGSIGYAWLTDHRVFVSTITNADNTVTGTELRSHADWGALMLTGHVAAAYEAGAGRFYARPELSADFLEFNEGTQRGTGGGSAFDLTISSRDSHRLSGQAILVVGREWGQATWLRTELRGGYRQILSSQIGDTVAAFSSGSPFALSPDLVTGGWVTAGFSIKGGSQYSYLALEGDADFRAGEHRFNIRLAGRSIF